MTTPLAMKRRKWDTAKSSQYSAQKQCLFSTTYVQYSIGNGETNSRRNWVNNERLKQHLIAIMSRVSLISFKRMTNKQTSNQHGTQRLISEFPPSTSGSRASTACSNRTPQSTTPRQALPTAGSTTPAVSSRSSTHRVWRQSTPPSARVRLPVLLQKSTVIEG